MVHLLTYDWIVNGIMTVAAIYLVFLKLDIYKVIGYDLYVDITFTVALLMYFQGTYNGALVATAAGLFLSILLRITRYFFGYKRFRLWDGRMQWVYHPR
jgi:hypothetical protein